MATGSSISARHYRFERSVEVFVRVENLLDARYATAGVLAELELYLSEVPDAGDPRFIGPGAPRRALGGVRVAILNAPTESSRPPNRLSPSLETVAFAALAFRPTKSSPGVCPVLRRRLLAGENRRSPQPLLLNCAADRNS